LRCVIEQRGVEIGVKEIAILKGRENDYQGRTKYMST
jgi:hypothetical protein